MITELTINTKEKIKSFVQDFVDNEVENFCYNYSYNEYNISVQLAIEELKDNFENIEFNYELLRDYYNENNEVKNLEQLKKLSCRYAKTLIN